MARSSFTSRRGLIALAVALLAALGIGMSGDGFFTPTFVLTLTSLNPKSLPMTLADDGDSKDVSIKDRVKFKPTAGGEQGLERRLRLKAKKTGGDAALGLDLQTHGNISASLRVAVDDTTGLLDGESLAFFERRAQDGSPPLRVEAVWSAGLDGLLLRGVIGGTPVGEPVELPGEREADLFITDVGTSISLSAGGSGLGGLFGTFDQSGGEADTAEWGYGVQGLGPSGAFWFAHLRFDWGPGDVTTGPVETDALISAFYCWRALLNAQQLLEDPPPHNLFALQSYLFSATIITSAWNTLQAGLDADTLLPSTEGPKVTALAKSTAGWVVPAFQDVSDLIEKDATSGASVKGHVKVALDKVELLMAQLNGFKSKSHNKLLDSAVFTVQ